MKRDKYYYAEILEDILEYLHSHPSSTIREIADQTHHSWVTIGRYLAKMEKEGKVRSIRVGRARGWWINDGR